MPCSNWQASVDAADQIVVVLDDPQAAAAVRGVGARRRCALVPTGRAPRR